MSLEDKIENLKGQLYGELNESTERLKDVLDAEEEDSFPYKNMVSASMFERFSECPKQWELRYKDKNYEPEDNENTIYGDSIHRLVENYMEAEDENEYDSPEKIEDKVKNAVKTSAEDVKDRFDADASNNREYPFTPQLLDQMVKDARKSFGQYIKFADQFFTDSLELVSVEEEFKGKTFHNLEFRGKVDLVFYDNEKDLFYIIDIKSSNSSWKTQDINFLAKKVQLLSYKFYFCKELEIPFEKVKTAFVVLNREGDAKGNFGHIESISIDSSVKRLKWTIKQWQKFLTKTTYEKGYFRDRNYEKNPTEKNCSRCPYSTQFNGNGMCDQKGRRFGKS